MVERGCEYYLENKELCGINKEEAFLWCRKGNEYKKCFRYKRQKKKEQQYLNRYLDFP